MRKLERHHIKTLEGYWINHKENIKQLKYREWELMSRNSDDENTGGGSNSVRTVSKPTEQLVIKLTEDKLYQNLLTITRTVESMYARLDEDALFVVNNRYRCAKRDMMEWEDIAYELGCSRSKVLRIRNSLLDEFAEVIGYA